VLAPLAVKLGDPVLLQITDWLPAIDTIGLTVTVTGTIKEFVQVLVAPITV
jgi:hypothetical protein